MEQDFENDGMRLVFRQVDFDLIYPKRCPIFDPILRD